MHGVLNLYLYGFVCPYLILLVTDDPKVTINVFKICLIPQILLLCVEVVQMYEDFGQYISNMWNWIDLAQIVTF